MAQLTPLAPRRHPRRAALRSLATFGFTARCLTARCLTAAGLTAAGLTAAALTAAALSGCAPGGASAPEPAPTPATARRTDEIRNGTREPEAVLLSPGQQLALGWLYSRGDAGRPFCTGTLVTGNVVATARHCIEGQRAGRLGFGVGVLPNDATATFNVARMHGHPTLDVAILVLEQDATEVVPILQPIPFNRDPLSNDLVGRAVQAGGYGETYDRRRFGRYFATVELTRVTATEVIVDGNGLQGICYGDSGGPVITPLGGDGPEFARVLAVESWGDPSCLDVDHLIRLDVVAAWIDDLTAEGAVLPDPTEGECGDLGYQGRCDGDRAVWCQDGQIETRNCARRDQVCGFINEEVGYFCTDAANLCGAVPTNGTCQGDVIQRCRRGAVEEEDCAAEGEVCQQDAGGAFCTAPWPPPDAAVPEPTGDAGVEPNPDDSPVPPIDEPTPDAGGGVPADGDEAPGGRGDAGCSATPDAPPAPAALAALLLLGGLRRRRR